MAPEQPSRGDLRREGLAFFGRTVAGQSHEVTNVLNVINELAGLQLDLLRAEARGGPARPDRLAEIADKIQYQVGRGESIVRCVNRFAHSVDLATAVLDLRDLLATAVALGQRSARLARTELVVDFPAETTALESDPFRVLHTVVTLVEVALHAAAGLRRVTVSYRLSAAGAEVEVASADPLAQPEPRLLALAEGLAAELGASCGTVRGAEGGCDRLVLRLPCHPPAKEGAAGTPTTRTEG